MMMIMIITITIITIMVGNNDLQEVKNTYILSQEDLELEFLHLNGVPLFTQYISIFTRLIRLFIVCLLCCDKSYCYVNMLCQMCFRRIKTTNSANRVIVRITSK